MFFIDNSTLCARCEEQFALGEESDKPIVFDCAGCELGHHFHQHVLHERCLNEEEQVEYRRMQRILAGVNGLN